LKKKISIQIEFSFLETKVVELSNENETLKAKLNLMLTRLNMKEADMESLFEEEQRLGHICLKPTTSASIVLGHRNPSNDDDDIDHLSQSVRPKYSSSSDTHEDDEVESTTIDDSSLNTRVQHPLLYNQLMGNNNGAIDLSRSEMKTTTQNKSPSPSPPNESLLQILANQILKTESQTSTRLLTIASPTESKVNLSSLKRTFNQIQDEEKQQANWDEAAMTLLSLKKSTPPPPPPPSAPIEQQTALQSVCQSVINGLLRKPNPPRATIDYHSTNERKMQGENFHQQDNINSFNQLKSLMNYFSTTSTNNSLSMPSAAQSSPTQTQSHEHRGDMMPLKLRMKMLNAKS